MFFKTAVLKNFAILSRKHLYWSVLLIHFQAYRPALLLKKRLQHMFFLMKFLRAAYFVKYIAVHYTFSTFYTMIEFFGSLWVQNLHFSYIFCTIALSSSMVHGYSVLVFTPKYLVSVSLARVATSASALF